MADAKQNWIVEVKKHPITGELFVELPLELSDLWKIKEGDEVEWTENADGTWSLHKVE